MPTNDHAADRALAKTMRTFGSGSDIEALRAGASAIVRLCNEADRLVLDKDAARDELNRRTLQRDETEHARALLLDDVADLRAKLATAREALTAIDEYRPPDYDEEPYVSIASFCKTKARAAMKAIKESDNAR
jgi:hypothetical protein